MSNLLFYPVWQQILMWIKDGESVAHRICNTHRLTYSHVSKIAKLLKKEGFINIKFKGRRNELTLTNKGQKLAYALRMVK